MDDKEMDQVIRRKVQKAVEKSLAEAWDDPFWAQLEELEDDVRLPPLDVQDHDDHFLLVVEMPGVPKDQVDIKVTESSVEVSGEGALECDIDAMETAYLCRILILQLQLTKLNLSLIVQLRNNYILLNLDTLFYLKIS